MNDDQVKRLTDHCQIENFRKNDAVNLKPPKGAVSEEKREKFNFIRKGMVGDWKNHFKDESTLKIWNQWISENNDTGIPIKFTL